MLVLAQRKRNEQVQEKEIVELCQIFFGVLKKPLSKSARERKLSGTSMKFPLLR